MDGLKEFLLECIVLEIYGKLTAWIVVIQFVLSFISFVVGVGWIIFKLLGG